MALTSDILSPPAPAALSGARDGDLAPVDEAAVARAVTAARAAGETLHLVGAGTRQAMLRPVSADRRLDLSRLDGVTLSAPKELIVSARAGTPVVTIAATLAASGQHLIAEPPDLSALLGGSGPGTIGGLVATNLSGPRRITAGGVRDHVMGIRAVAGSGETFHSGGRVLKNVTGLDLCKLLCGSQGTLAVITEVTLKVLPAPETSATLAIPCDDATDAVALLSSGLGSPFGVSGAAWLPAGSRTPAALGDRAGGVALLRIEDFSRSVTYRIGRLRDLLRRDASVVEGIASETLWRAVRDALPIDADASDTAASDAVWRLSVRPSAAPAAFAVLRAAGMRTLLDWGGGLIWAASPAGDGAQAEAASATVSSAAAVSGGTWMLMRAPPAQRGALAPVPPEPATLAAIGARLRGVLDPDAVLNPGRLGRPSRGAAH